MNCSILSSHLKHFHNRFNRAKIFLRLSLIVILMIMAFPNTHTFSQSTGLDIEKLTELQRIVTNWQSNDYKYLTGEAIFDTLRIFASTSKSLMNDVQRESKLYKNAIQHLKGVMKAEEVLDSYSIGEEFTKNRFRASDKYLNKTFNIQGSVIQIDKNFKGEKYVALAKHLQCFFQYDGQINDLSVGDFPMIQGKIAFYVPVANTFIIQVTDCKLSSKSDYDLEIKAIWSDLEIFLDDFLEKLNKIIKKENSRLSKVWQ